MKTPFLVVISGPPATGKTALGRRLAERLELPFFFKDQFKELLFDTLGAPDLERSRQYGRLSFQVLKTLTEELLAHAISHVIEGNFSAAEFSPYLRGLQERFDFDLYQVQLTCRGDVLAARFLRRSRSGEIHPGHQGERYFASVRERLLAGQAEPFDAPGRCFTFDTTDFAAVDFEPLFRELAARIGARDGVGRPMRSER